MNHQVEEEMGSTQTKEESAVVKLLQHILSERGLLRCKSTERVTGVGTRA